MSTKDVMCWLRSGPALRGSGLDFVLFGCLCCALTGCGAKPAIEERAAQLTAAPTIALTSHQVTVAGMDAADLAELERARPTPEQWRAILGVTVDEGKGEDRPTVLGTYSVERNLLVFTPRFPLLPGVRYRVVLDESHIPEPAVRISTPVVAEFTLPKSKTVPTVVACVYPTRDVLPENQLKFYIHFSAPMSRGEAYEHIQLLDSKGKQVELPFLELGEELWDPAGKRFTLFFDPGRIKRGLKPREEVGPALEEGKNYTLVIDREWHDAEGNPLKETFRKSFRVAAPDDTPPDPKTWKLQPPTAGQTAPLVVVFPKPLDHALLHRLLWVTNAAGEKVPGQVAVSEAETRWQFTPEKPWPVGTYRLVADTALEDLAGNSIGRPFEVDEFRPVTREVKSQTVALPFEVRAGSAP